MAGVTSGVGIFSGINSANIIDQLMAIESLPKTQIQARITDMKRQQAAFLDLNSRLGALKDAAAAFRLNKIFQTRSASSSDADTLTATAGTDAAPGSYSFIVDRLVSTQQMLSAGFANRDSSAMGATSFTFESTKARLDKDVALSDLNGGAGVSRGRIVVTDSAGHASTIDLSRTLTLNEVVDAINNNGTAQVTASVQGNKLVVSDNAHGALSIANASGYTTATSLGIAGTAAGGTITGSTIYSLASTTLISSLNDGNGISIHSSVGTGAFSFSINVGGATPATVNVNLGDVYTEDANHVLTKTEGAVTTVGGAITRINAALTAAGVSNVSASIDGTNGRLLVTDSSGTQPLTITENGSTTAADLGLTTTPVAGSIQGRRVFAGLNTTLVRGLNGGNGIAGDGVLNFTARDGTAFAVTIDPNASLNDLFNQIQTASGTGVNGLPRISVALDARGTGIVVTDNTGGSQNLIITGTSGQDSAASLGIATVPAGIAAATQSSGNLQRQYISLATQLSTLNAGRGIGTGTIRITDSTGASATVEIGDDARTLADIVDEINHRPDIHVTARINDHGDGLLIQDSNSPAGTLKLKVEDVSGNVAKNLNLAGEATGTGVDNKIDGSYERTVTFSAADSLQAVTDKINAARVGVTASIIQDGSSTAPFRLNLTSQSTGEAGRFIIGTGTLDIGLQTLDAGHNARVFFGSNDPARALAITSTTNTVDKVVPGLKIDLHAVKDSPVTVNVATDTTAIEKAVKDFVDAFNTTVDHLTAQTSYDQNTDRGGALLGDSAAIELRSALYSAFNSSARSINSQYDKLSEVGINVGPGGKLSLDSDRFQAALATDPAGVQALFEARVPVDDSRIDMGGGVFVNNPNSGHSFSSLGVMGMFEEMAGRYTDSINGVLTLRSKGLDAQIADQNKRIDDLDARLEIKRQLLEAQFRAMEEAIGKLQTQQGALGSIGGAR
jgi:flagellar hook-associated protein 2